VISKQADHEQLAAVGAAAAIFAHEVGNPLNNVYMHTQLLDRRLRALRIGEAALGDLETILREVQRLNRLLEEFRALYRQRDIQRAPTDLGQLVDEVIAMQGPSCECAPIRYELERPAELPPIVGDHDKLEQVLINLCKNAIEAMPNGGTLNLRITPMDGSIRLDVEDTGAGIDPCVDVFEPFSTTKRNGTGLGLAVARQIIGAHGGTITFQSELSKGTTFTIVLPIDPDCASNG
jgi:signal transduction histidine kinase